MFILFGGCSTAWTLFHNTHQTRHSQVKAGGQSLLFWGMIALLTVALFFAL